MHAGEDQSWIRGETNVIYEKLADLLAEHFGVQRQDISRDTDLKKDLAVDSLDLYELGMIVEEEFNVEIPDDQLPQIHTVADLVKLLKELGVEE